MTAEEYKECPVCTIRLKLLKRSTGMVRLSLPLETEYYYWCGHCGWTSEKFWERQKTEDTIAFEAWEKLNKLGD